jgi:hypothetical protein
MNPEAQCRLEALPLFKARASLIRAFRRRHRLSSGRPSLKRRTVATPENHEAFMSGVKNLMLECLPETIIQFDETNRQSISLGFWT